MKKQDQITRISSLNFQVAEIDQGDLREFAANAHKLAPHIADLKPGEVRWRRNNADNRHRFAGKLPNGRGFVAMLAYDPDDLTSTFLQGAKLLAQLNHSHASIAVVNDAEASVARAEKRKKKGGKK